MFAKRLWRKTLTEKRFIKFNWKSYKSLLFLSKFLTNPGSTAINLDNSLTRILLLNEKAKLIFCKLDSIVLSILYEAPGHANLYIIKIYSTQ